MFTFPVGPFPVTVELSFLLMAVFFGYDRQGGVAGLVSWVIVVFVSVLVHELGHAVVGRSLGAKPRILLQGMGGLTLTPLPRKLTWGESVSLSVAGPAAGLLPGLAAAALLLATNPGLQALTGRPGLLLRTFLGADGRSDFESLLFTFVRTSLFWTALNLLPVLPLDGGNVLQATLAALRKKPSLSLAYGLSAAFAALLALCFYFRVLPGGLFLAIFFVAFAVQGLVTARRLAGPAAPAAEAPDADAGRDVASALEAARALLLRGDNDAAVAVADRLEQAGGPLRGAVAARIRAGVHLSRGENDRAGLEAGRSFALVPHPDAAVVAARAALRGGAESAARTWLRRALEAGANPEAIRADAELAALG